MSEEPAVLSLLDDSSYHLIAVRWSKNQPAEYCQSPEIVNDCCFTTLSIEVYYTAIKNQNDQKTTPHFLWS